MTEYNEELNGWRFYRSRHGSVDALDPQGKQRTFKHMRAFVNAASPTNRRVHGLGTAAWIVSGFIAFIVIVMAVGSSGNDNSSIPAASSKPIINSTHFHDTLPVTHLTPGCKSAATFEKLRALMDENDNQAVGKFLIDHAVDGDCIIIEKGTTVTVEDVSVWHDTRCIRPRGETDCYWTFSMAIKQPGDAE